VVAVMRGLAPPNAIQMALAYDKDYNVPTAPGLGLYLVRGKARGGGGGAAGGTPCPTL
jgi:tRNA U38,U39,U40 pseudouridine synthase TruA